MADEYTPEELRSFLTSLGMMLAADNRQYDIMLFGGGVMCYAKEIRSMTKDIDFVYLDAGILYDSDEYFQSKITAVAEKRGLDEMWMESTAGVHVTQEIRDTAELFEVLGGLRIFIPSLEAILALKTLSARTDTDKHDVEDVRWLLEQLSIIPTADELLRVARDYCGLEVDLLYSNAIKRQQLLDFVELVKR